MTLKRSISKRVKNTFAKTKRLVSPSVGPSRSPSGTFNDTDSFSSCGSNLSWDPSGTPAGDAVTNNANTHGGASISSSTNTESFQGLGIFKDVSAAASASSGSQNHTQANSISSIQKSVSHIISATKSNLNTSNSGNGTSGANDYASPGNDTNHHPTLLYTGRRKSNSIRRNKSIQQIHPLDYIDTNINQTTLNSNPISFSAPKDYFHEAANYNEPSQASYHKNDEEEVILLPVDPVDKSKPPCTTEQLTPILPLSLDSSYINGNGNSYFDINPNDKPPLIVSNLSSSTSTTLNSSFLEPTTRGTPTSSTTSPIRITLSASNFKPEEVPLELFQPDVNPIFAKSYQIDHLDKELDLKKKDRLADQMALNILQHISEENVDELSKLKEEISMKF